MTDPLRTQKNRNPELWCLISYIWSICFPPKNLSQKACNLCSNHPACCWQSIVRCWGMCRNSGDHIWNPNVWGPTLEWLTLLMKMDRWTLSAIKDWKNTLSRHTKVINNFHLHPLLQQNMALGHQLPPHQQWCTQQGILLGDHLAHVTTVSPVIVCQNCWVLFNPSGPVWRGCNFRCIVFKHMFLTDFCRICCAIHLSRMPKNISEYIWYLSTSVQLTWLYLIQCWPISILS